MCSNIRNPEIASDDSNYHVGLLRELLTPSIMGFTHDDGSYQVGLLRELLTPSIMGFTHDDGSYQVGLL